MSLRASHPCLPRPRLTDALTSDDARLTTVVAPAGYGKTTLLSGWAHPARAAWHTFTAADRELLPALDHLVRALRSVVPRLDFTLPSLAGDAHALGAALSAALGRVELVLVLDDVHVIDGSDVSARLLEALCQQLPPTVRLVLSSRRPPPFPVQRLRTDGRLVELTAEQLAFTPDEVAALLVDQLGLDPGPAEQVHRVTRGWPIAVRLAGEALRHNPTAGQGHLPAAGSLFDYVASEIVDREPASTRQLIRTAARFERFRPELLEALGHPAAREIIVDLAGRGLFVESLPAPPGWFGLMPLARDFVRNRMPMADGELRALHRAAARWFEANDHLDAAFAALAEPPDVAAITSLLDERADDLLRQRGADAVLAAVRLVPPEARDPRTWQLAGEAHQVRGDWDLAMDCLMRTVDDQARLTADVARRMGWLKYLSGAPGAALAVCRRFVPDGSDPAAESLLLSCVASAEWACGQLAACAEAAAQAMTLARACADDAALAAAHTVSAMAAAATGDPVALAEHSRAGLRHAQRAGDVLSAIRLRSNRASHLVEAGDYHAALAELEVALPMTEVTGFTTYRALCLSNRGEARLGLGQLDEAVADLAAAESVFTEIGSCLAAVPLTLLAEVHRLRGNRVLAKTAYQHAIRLAERHNTVTQLVPALTGLARLLADDDPPASARLVARALSFGAGVGRAAALLAGAVVELGQGAGLPALRAATEAELQARERGDKATLAESLELQARAHGLLRSGVKRQLSLVDEAVAVWRDLGNSRNESRLAAVRDTISGAPVPNQPSVFIQTLGGFRVLRHGEPIPVTAWQSRKARDLVKILVARRGHPVTRETLISLLWPEERAHRASNRLSVALSTARTVLGSQRRAARHCLITEADTVRLDTGVATVDVLCFLADAQRGLRDWRHEIPEAITRLSAAEARYTGDFLIDDPAQDWAGELREEARLNYIQVATVLAEHAERAGDHLAASRYCLRILERDRHHEPAHLALVRALVAAGSHGEARRRYRTYVDRMAEVDVEARPFPEPPAS